MRTAETRSLTGGTGCTLNQRQSKPTKASRTSCMRVFLKGRYLSVTSGAESKVLASIILATFVRLETRRKPRSSSLTTADSMALSPEDALMQAITSSQLFASHPLPESDPFTPLLSRYLPHQPRPQRKSIQAGPQDTTASLIVRYIRSLGAVLPC